MGQKHVGLGTALRGALHGLSGHVVQHWCERDRGDRMALLRPAVRVVPGNTPLLIALISALVHKHCTILKLLREKAPVMSHYVNYVSSTV